MFPYGRPLPAQRALDALLACPQNNLRVFVDQQLVLDHTNAGTCRVVSPSPLPPWYQWEWSGAQHLLGVAQSCSVLCVCWLGWSQSVNSCMAHLLSVVVTRYDP